MIPLENNNIPAGYKDSAVGIIPQEWEVKTFQECFHISAGRDLQKEYYSEKQTLQYQYPIFSNSLENRGLYGYTSNPRHKAGSITITGRGMLGVAEYRDVDFDAIVRLLVLYPKKEIAGQVVTEYINYRKPFYFESTGVPQLTAPQISNIPIPVPPLAEQRKIAEILGVWDEAIEKQSRLIEKLELRKRALMQRLLTGRTRLPGFTTPWQKVKLGEIGKITSAGVDKKINEGEVPVRLLNFVDVFYRDFIYNNELTHWVTAKSTKVEQCSVQKGDIFFTPSSEMPTDIALSAVAMEDMEGIVYSYHIVRLRLHIEMDLYYRAYAFKTDEFYKQAERICDGSGQRYVISQDGFRNMSIHLPPLPEQKAIAEVLTTADDEIATHRKKLDALRLQKRGLMQQLLTGKTRVKI